MQRNRAEISQGRDAIMQFLKCEWEKDLDYRLVKELKGGSTLLIIGHQSIWRLLVVIINIKLDSESSIV